MLSECGIETAGSCTKKTVTIPDEFGEVYRPEGKLRLKNFFKELAVGTGVGLRFDMEMLVVRADLGIAIHAPYDTGKSGYYNIRKFGDSLALHLAIGYPF